MCTNKIMNKLTETYKVICRKCTNSDRVAIESGRDVYWGSPKHIISARKRLDGNWGWQCMCGNNDLMTLQEKRQIKNPQTPDPADIKTVLKNLKVQTPKFVMEKA